MGYRDLVDDLGTVYEDREFSVEEARIDYLDIKSTENNFKSSENLVRSFVEYAYRFEPSEIAELRFPDRENGVVFNRPQVGSENWKNITVRAGRSDHTPVIAKGTPLFAMALGVRKRKPTDGGPLQTISVDASINPNPTRFCRHFVGLYASDGFLGASRPNIGDDNIVSLKHCFARSFPKWCDNETPLDFNDNVFLGSGWPARLPPEVYRRLTTEYLALLCDLPQDLITEYAWNDGRVLDQGEGYSLSLRKVEVYWERASANPLRDIKWLSERLLALGMIYQVFAYGIRGQRANAYSELSRFGNSLYVTVRIREGVSLAVYAKTNFRLRFELKYDLTENANLIGGRHTTTEFAELRGWLDDISEAATDEINALRPHLVVEEGSVTEEDAQRAVANLHIAIEKCRLSPVQKDHLFRTLLFHGCYVLDGDREMKVALDRLSRNGFLVATARGVRSLTEDWLERAVPIRLSLVGSSHAERY